MRSALSLILAVYSASAAEDFARDIKPVLEKNCLACHNPANPKSRVDFLKAKTESDLESKRLLWRDVATQLRNRTMPPMASKLSEKDRLGIATWIDDRLRLTACSTGEIAAAIPPRRLNRREYHQTIRDLLGLDFNVADIFPADESGGNGFDTNGETLYLPPMLLERYMEAAQKILDRVIVTLPMTKTFPSAEMNPPKPGLKPGRSLAAGEQLTAEFPIFVDGSYNLKVSIERPKEVPVTVQVKVDQAQGSTLSYARDSNGGPTTRTHVATLTRGVHSISAIAGGLPVDFYSLTVEQRGEPVSAEKRALHFRLFGLEAGEAPVDTTLGTRRLLESFLRRAYRRPIAVSDTNPFFAIYKRAFERGDPYEEAVKMALKAVLVSPRFLFRVEDVQPELTPKAIGQFDFASRLSYFLWSSSPDEELLRLAEQGRLQDPAVIHAQVDRMIDNPRSRSLAKSFIGQWLGTQEVGGRVVPLLTELQHYYTPEVAADLREEPVLLFHHLFSSGRSLLELLNANYSFLTARLAKFYQVEDRLKTPLGDQFTRVEWPDDRRAGVLGMASVLAMNSHYKQASPVLRGAWVLDTILGTPVPPPPPDVPPLETAAKSEKGLTMRQIVQRHRADAACASCHNLMDPIGLGLENFDWMGRWRDTESSGSPVDNTGTLPSGETFAGAVGLRKVLLERKEEFLRHVSGKLLGYALGRSMQDSDQCTVQHIVDMLGKENYSSRTLIHEIALSSPFRNTQALAGSPVSANPGVKRKSTRLLGDK